MLRVWDNSGIRYCYYRITAEYSFVDRCRFITMFSLPVMRSGGFLKRDKIEYAEY